MQRERSILKVSNALRVGVAISAEIPTSLFWLCLMLPFKLFWGVGHPRIEFLTTPDTHDTHSGCATGTLAPGATELRAATVQEYFYPSALSANFFVS